MLRISYTGGPGAWEGVVRDDAGDVVISCGHKHPNRDSATTYRSAAMRCMRSQVQVALQPMLRKCAPKAHLERLDELETALANRPVQFYNQTIEPAPVKYVLTITPVSIRERPYRDTFDTYANAIHAYNQYTHDHDLVALRDWSYGVETTFEMAPRGAKAVSHFVRVWLEPAT
jgi:hypothetical protein